jgi:hypothetical protein
LLFEVQRFLLDIEHNGAYNKEGTLEAVGWADKFYKVIQLFQHAPVFKLKPTGNVPVNINKPKPHKLFLEPLHPFLKGYPDSWGNLVGFTKDPTVDLRRPSSKYLDYFL